MKTVTVNELTDIIANIDYLFENTYPVKFAIDDNLFEAGVDIQNKKIYLKNLWDAAPTIIWSTTYDMDEKRINEILTREAKIGEKQPVIYLYDELSFDGSTISN